MPWKPLAKVLKLDDGFEGNNGGLHPKQVVVIASKDLPTALPAGMVGMAVNNITIGWPGLIFEISILTSMGMFSASGDNYKL